MRATIEPIDDDPGRVRITPFVPHIGCMCSVALTVPKDAVGSLARTDELHRCCGKTLSVVEVELTDETLKDVFSQLIDAMSVSTPAHYSTSHDPSLPGADRRTSRFTWDAGQRRNSRCQEDYEACMASAMDDFDRCICRNIYNGCVFPPLPLFSCPPPEI
jgi:hypothetical protein